MTIIFCPTAGTQDSLPPSYKDLIFKRRYFQKRSSPWKQVLGASSPAARKDLPLGVEGAVARHALHQICVILHGVLLILSDIGRFEQYRKVMYPTRPNKIN